MSTLDTDSGSGPRASGLRLSSASMILGALIFSAIGVASLDLSGSRKQLEESAPVRLPPAVAGVEMRAAPLVEEVPAPAEAAEVSAEPMDERVEVASVAPQPVAPDPGIAPPEPAESDPGAGAPSAAEPEAAQDDRLAGAGAGRSAGFPATPLGSNAWSPLLDGASNARRLPVRELGLADVVRRVLRLTSPEQVSFA